MILQISEVAAKLKLLYLIARQAVPSERTIQQPYLLGCSRNSPQYLTRRTTALFKQAAIVTLFGAKKIHYTPSYTFPLTCILICGNKMPTRCNRGFLLQILLLAQRVSAITMPIIRSSRVLYSGCCVWYFVLWFFQVAGLVWS